MNELVNNTRGYYGHRERQRDRILMTAEQLFIRDGIDNVSIADIADAVGMTRATIYRYFANGRCNAVIQKISSIPCQVMQPTNVYQV